MRNAGPLVAALAVIALVMWLVFSLWTGAEASYSIAGVALDESRASDSVQLFGSSTSLTTGAYDSMRSASGTPFTVPADRQLLLSSLTVYTTDATTTLITVGHAPTSVQDSSTAPSGGDEVFRAVLPAKAELYVVRMSALIPAGGIPWIRIDNGATWSAPATGLLVRDDFPVLLP